MRSATVPNGTPQSFLMAATALDINEEDLGTEAASVDSYTVGARQRRVVTGIVINGTDGITGAKNFILRGSLAGDVLFQYRVRASDSVDISGVAIKGAVGDEMTVEINGALGGTGANILIQTEIRGALG